MVNTFVTVRHKTKTCFVPDYRESASLLDIQRLRKQCVEAHQILNILAHLYKISELEGWDVCIPVSLSEHTLPPEEQATRYLSRVKWVKDIRQRYLNLDYRYIIIEGNVQKVPKNQLPYRVDKSTGVWTVNDDSTVTVWIKESNKILPPGTKILTKEDGYDLSRGIRTRNPVLFPRDQVSLPGDEIITLGFAQHAIIKMWIGYEDSLREYINAHIDEYCTNVTKTGRRCSMNLHKHKLPKKYPHPWWITNFDGVIMSHRASLLRKERERNETPWYINKKIFTSTPSKWLNTGYVWTGSFDISIAHYLITSIISGQEVDIEDITAPISSDNQPRKSQEQLCKKYNYTGPYILDQNGKVKIRFVE